MLRTAAELSRSGAPADQIEAALRSQYPINAATAVTQSAAAGQQIAAAGPQAEAAAIRALLDGMIRQAVADEVSGLMAEIIELRAEVARLTAALSAGPQQAELQEPTDPQEPQQEPQPERPARRWWEVWRR